MLNVIALFPLWVRFGQCVKRYIQTGVIVNFWNSTKYFSKELAPITLVIFGGMKIGKEGFWWCFAAKTWAEIYSLGWDYYIDWGYFRSWKPGHWGLRDQMLFSRGFYYYATLVNLVARSYYLVTIFNYGFESDPDHVMNNLQVMLFISMIMETYRRTIWAVLRIENEYFNNFEAYRSIPAIPILMDEKDKTAYD